MNIEQSIKISDLSQFKELKKSLQKDVLQSNVKKFSPLLHFDYDLTTLFYAFYNFDI
ncbi:hypothetical protein [Campylobacter concisus]